MTLSWGHSGLIACMSCARESQWHGKQIIFVKMFYKTFQIYFIYGCLILIRLICFHDVQNLQVPLEDE